MAKYGRETKIGELTEERAGKTGSLYIPPGSGCLATSTRIPAGQLGHNCRRGELRILRTSVHRNPGFGSNTAQRTFFLNIMEQLVFCAKVPKNIIIRIPDILYPILRASPSRVLYTT